MVKIDSNIQLLDSSPALSGTHHDLDLAGTAQLNTANTITLTGAVAVRGGRLLAMTTTATGSFTCNGESASSAAANRFASSFVVAAAKPATFCWYDAISQRWRVT